MPKKQDKMYEMRFRAEVDSELFCNNCGNEIDIQEPQFWDAENEIGYCFYCYKHLFGDPYEDVPEDLESYG